jgi:hypothetical protein
MDLSLLAFKKPGARGTHPSTNELRDALRDNPDRLDTVLLGLGAGLQEGVVGSGDGLITRPTSTSIRIAAGSAWIDGDGANPGGAGGLNGRYRVTWPQTDLTPPLATGANFRGHRVTIPIPAGGHGSSAPVLRSGVDDASVNLDTMNVAGAAGGVPALPAGELQVAVAITDSGGVPSTGIRDRRRFAQGFRHRHHRTASTSTSTTSSTVVNLWAGAADIRAEIIGTNILEIGLDAHITAPPSGSIYSLWLYNGDFSAGGIALKEWRFPAGFDADVSIRFPWLPGVTSTALLKWYHSVSVSGSTGKVDINSTNNWYADVVIREFLGGVNGNGAT